MQCGPACLRKKRLKRYELDCAKHILILNRAVFLSWRQRGRVCLGDGRQISFVLLYLLFVRQLPIMKISPKCTVLVEKRGAALIQPGKAIETVQYFFEAYLVQRNVERTLDHLMENIQL